MFQNCFRLILKKIVLYWKCSEIFSFGIKNNNFYVLIVISICSSNIKRWPCWCPSHLSQFCINPDQIGFINLQSFSFTFYALCVLHKVSKFQLHKTLQFIKSYHKYHKIVYLHSSNHCNQINSLVGTRGVSKLRKGPWVASELRGRILRGYWVSSGALQPWIPHKFIAVPELVWYWKWLMIKFAQRKEKSCRYCMAWSFIRIKLSSLRKHGKTQGWGSSRVSKGIIC